MRDRLMVGHSPLEAGIMVRIHVPQPLCKVSVSRLARGFAPRSRQFGGQVGGRIFKQFLEVKEAKFYPEELFQP
ncbi:MAG: hypothetical protein UY38_C0001G0232 [Parcubacteria group bacterium GW2011_GWB1_49_12]|uniref:Uncharacterized protein n=1 Tax=Candidatus Yanofskybacteria bacterium GW2011_GWC1_48_11 TaxID=1619027 RepID=A0A837ILC5_9BACT|nr:MAG: hypothetical protein UY25_C0002G0086 [Candidatus Yanofskybacteria bacterium GW2011_GWC1_48_11]KKW04665.1 MAG: hypothetical protein UY38_C0001G0232 [Parcubacteria group bacterium GW2011_GWB1_49_12]